MLNEYRYLTLKYLGTSSVNGIFCRLRFQDSHGNCYCMQVDYRQAKSMIRLLGRTVPNQEVSNYFFTAHIKYKYMKHSQSSIIYALKIVGYDQMIFQNSIY